MGAVDQTVQSPAILDVTLGVDMLTHNKKQPVARVPVGSTSTVLRGTIVNASGTAIDLSGATGAKYFHSSTQAGGSLTYQGVASFTTDGTDGKVQFQLTAQEVGSKGSVRAEFEIQGYNGGNLVTEVFLIQATERAAVAP